MPFPPVGRSSMTIEGAEPMFVDTNVLVYASWRAAPLHTQTLAAYRAAGVPLVISRQIIREFFATLYRPRSGI